MGHLITVPQAAQVLRVPQRTVRRWCARHGLGIQVSRRLRLLTEDDVARLRELAGRRAIPQEDNDAA